LHDESFDADWSRNPMCVADPFVVAKNCTGQIQRPIFTRFIRECRNTEGMLRLGISLKSILSKEPSFDRPKGGKREKKKQARKDQDSQTQEKRVPAQKQKPRPRPGPSHSGVQRGGSNPQQNHRGGKRGGAV